MPWAKKGPREYFYGVRRIKGKNEHFYIGLGDKVEEYLRCQASGEVFVLPESKVDEIRFRHRNLNRLYDKFKSMVKKEVESDLVAMGFHKNNSIWTMKRMSYIERKRHRKKGLADILARRIMKQRITTFGDHIREMAVGSIPLEPKVQKQIFAEIEAMKSRLNYEKSSESIRIVIDQHVTAYVAHFIAAHELYTRPINRFEPRERMHLERQFHRTSDILHRSTVLLAAMEMRLARAPLSFEPEGADSNALTRPYHEPDSVDKENRAVYTVWPTDPSDVHWQMTDGDISAKQKRNCELYGFLEHYQANPGTLPSDIQFIEVVRKPSAS